MTKTKFVTFIATAAAGLFLSACATLVTKGSQEITFRGISGTTVTDTKKNTVIAEIAQNGFATVRLKKRLSGVDVKATKEGYDPLNIHMGTKIQPWFWGNILLGGISRYGHRRSHRQDEEIQRYSRGCDINAIRNNSRY